MSKSNKLVDTMTHVPATASVIRDTLFEEIKSLRAGKSDVPRAKAVVSMANAVIASIRTQVEVRKLQLSAARLSTSNEIDVTPTKK